MWLLRPLPVVLEYIYAALQSRETGIIYKASRSIACSRDSTTRAAPYSTFAGYNTEAALSIWDVGQYMESTQL